MTALGIRVGALAAVGALAVAGTIATAAVATGAPATAACTSSALTVTHTPTEGATGHASVVLLFRNVSKHTCSLYGYPGLDALNKSGHVLAHATRTLHGFAGGTKAVQKVTLAPARFASATVEWMNFNSTTSGDCTFSKSIATTPANTTHVVHLAVSVSVCDLQVHPTVAGTSGYNNFANAQSAWKKGASASSAAEGSYWSKAATALKADGSEYGTAIAQLHQLIALPDADQTAAQNKTYHHDIAALNSLFGTPGLYS